MERVGIFHCKFTNADQSRPRSCFIAELSLYLIYHKRIFHVALSVIPHKMNGGFFMCHTKHKRTSAAVMEAGHFFTNALISAGFLPDRSRHNDRKLDFLPINRVHFFTDDLFYLPCDSFQRHIGWKNTVCHILHIAAAHHQSMAVNAAVWWSFPKTISNKFFHFHKGYLRILFLNTKKP